MFKKAIYAGSFAPVHLGHIYVLSQACDLFDEVHILLAKNIDKQSVYSVEFRIELLKIATQEFKNIQIVCLNGLVADYMEMHKIKYAIRGIRDSNDFCYEQNMSFANAKLNKNYNSIFIPTKQELSHISSTLVRECLHYGRDIKEFVPNAVLEILQKYPNGK